MKGINMDYIKRIDLRRHVRKYEEEYFDAIKNVCREAYFSGGKYADQFEEEFAEYCGTAYASGVNNGTSALHCAMMALGIGRGDEVIVPANTYIATAWAPTYTGAVPVFADCTPDTWEIDPAKVEACISSKTKAIIGVHLYGQPFEVDEINRIAEEHKLAVVEDCAQAHGAVYHGKKVGGLSEIGCFSFYPGKNLFCFGEGGMVTSNHEEYIRHVNRLKNQGCSIRYYHEETGYNMRMEGIQGAVLSVGLRHLEENTKRRIEIGDRYLREISNPLIQMQVHPENTQTVYHLFVVKVKQRKDFIGYMEENGIGCDMHYPVPCHLQDAYSYLNYKKGDCPNAEELAEQCVTLPLFPELTDSEVGYIIEKCNKYRNGGQ